MIQNLTKKEIEGFKLSDQIGRGSFGDVYKVKHGDYDLVVKLIHCEKDIQKEISREVNTLMKCKHENIIKMLGSAKCGDGMRIAMEFAECGTLDDYLFSQNDKYSKSTALNYMQQLAKGVKYLHDMNIIHRDIKPANLFLKEEYTVLKIGDFGSVRKETLSSMTSDIGTVAYQSPEIAKFTRYTTKTDIYSCGIVFWALMTQRKPYDHLNVQNVIAIIGQVSNGVRPPISAVNSEGISSLIKNCWSRDPDKRPCGEELLDELDKIVAEF